MKVIIFDAKEYDEKTFNKANEENKFQLSFEKERLTTGSVTKAEGYDAVCTFVNCEVNKDVLEKLASLGIKFIFQRSAGYNNIDLVKAKELGINIYRVPAYSPEAVAEHAIALLISLNRNIHLANERTKKQDFTLNGLEGDTIFGQTIGVMGAGRIGQSFIKIAKGFGTNVIVFDEFAQKNFPDTAKNLGFKYVDKETLLKESDYISLHLPLMPSTEHIINKETINQMKKNAIIINTARGKLINTKDLIEAIESKKIRGAGLDVYENEQGIFFYDKSSEKIDDDILEKLLKNDNIIITSHQAFFTNLALKQIAETTVANMVLASKNEDGNTRLILQEDGKVLNG